MSLKFLWNLILNNRVTEQFDHITTDGLPFVLYFNIIHIHSMFSWLKWSLKLFFDEKW